MSQKPGDESSIIFHTVDDVLNFPDPEWLIKDMIAKGTFVVLYGPAGAGKSFLALSWAFAVAAGRSWLDYPVTHGPALYIAAEGGFGLKLRIAAQLQRSQFPAGLPIRFMTEPVQIVHAKPGEGLLHAIRKEFDQPALIIIDTLARCFTGGDENSAKDMGIFVDAVEQLKRETGATILVVHHAGKNVSSGARGSSALIGAADTMIKCEGEGGYFSVDCEKQRDAEPFEKISLALLAVELDGGGSSCVPVSLLDAPAPPPPIWVKNVEQVMEILRTDFGSEGAVHGDWKRACIEKLGFSASTFDRALKNIKKKEGLIRIEGSGEGARYFPDWVP